MKVERIGKILAIPTKQGVAVSGGIRGAEWDVVVPLWEERGHVRKAQ